MVTPMSPEAASLVRLLGALLVLGGLVGTILPALPGAPLAFAGFVLAAWADGFTRVGWFTLTLLALLTVASMVLDFLATRHGAKRAGASTLAVVGATVGTVVGLFFSIPGLILGPFLGAFAGEYLARRNWRQAGKAGLGTWLGLVVGTALKIAVIFAMIGIFLLSYAL
jgi:uncharacterized protein YqgC (DUF456 family)